MKLVKIKEILDADLLCGDEYLEKEIIQVCGTDLLSDVLAFAKADALLLTGLVNPQVIRTAEVADIAAICFLRGKKPEKSLVEISKKVRIPLLCSRLQMYDACGMLFKNGLKSCSTIQEV